MPYLVICHDAPNAPQLRKQFLQAHLDYIASIIDQVSVAGPTTGLQSAGIDGSCFIYKTDDLQLVRQLFYNDPYVINGIYREHLISRFVPAAGEWIGGKIW